MNAAQTSLYFFEWGQVRKHYLKKGIDPKQADHKRHELHKKALGRDKSSKAFTNADLDKVIAAFRAVSDDGNLNAQLRQIEQPEERRRAHVKRAHAAMRTFLTFETEAQFQQAAENYANGTARNMFGARFDELPEAQLAQVMGALVRTAGVKKKQREHAEVETEAQPF